MKKSIVQFGALVVFGLSVVSGAMAEDLERMKVTIPFEFKAGGTTLPAGVYTIVEANEAGLIRISGEKSAMMVTHPGTSLSVDAQPVIEFRKTQQGEILTEVRVAGRPANVLSTREQ